MITRLAALLALALITAGCLVETPDDAAWRELARHTLEDTASEVETVRLAAEQHRSGRLFLPYTKSVVVESEKKLSKAVESLESAQTPPGLDRTSTQVGDLLDEAADVVRQARQDVIAGRAVDTALIAQLSKSADALTRMEGALRR